MDAIATAGCIETEFDAIDTGYECIKIICNDTEIGWNDMKTLNLNEETEIDLRCVEIKFDFIGIKYKCMHLKFYYVKIEHANKKAKCIAKKIKKHLLIYVQVMIELQQAGKDTWLWSICSCCHDTPRICFDFHNNDLCCLLFLNPQKVIYRQKIIEPNT